MRQPFLAEPSTTVVSTSEYRNRNRRCANTTNTIRDTVADRGKDKLNFRLKKIEFFKKNTIHLNNYFWIYLRNSIEK